MKSGKKIVGVQNLDNNTEQIQSTTTISATKNINKILYGPIASVIISVFIFISSQLIGYLLVAGFYYFKNGQDSIETLFSEPSVVLQFSLFFTVEALVLILIYLFLKSRNLAWVDIGVKNKINLSIIGKALIVFLVYLFSTAILMNLLDSTTTIDFNQKQQIGFDEIANRNDLILAFISLVILAPVAEEILMRGFLFSGLRNKIKFLPSALVVSILFGVLHLQIGTGAPPLWSAAIDTFILSMFLVYLREKTGSVWAGVIVHALKNLLAFIFLFVITIPGM